MNKKEESSVKLDLGQDHDDEEDEEEDEEEEEEEEEVIEEDNEDEVVDFNFGGEDANVILEMNGINNENEKKLENENPAVIETNQEEQLQINPGNNNKKKTDKSQTQFKKLLNTQDGTTRQKTDPNSEKTVFTRISEDLFNKFVSNKDTQNKKTSAYDYLINDMFLNRVVEKNDRDSTSKFNNFVARNKEFRDKKSLKLQERTEKIANEINSSCTGIPNGKVLNKNEIRDPNEFLSDQLKYYTTRDQNINQQREDIKKTTDAQLKAVPEISKNSKELAEKKLLENNLEKEVHGRLYQDKIHKEKKVLLSEEGMGNVSKINIDGNKSIKPQKKTKEEIQHLVEKLYKDAEERKVNKEKKQMRLKEFYNMYGSDDDLTTNSSKLKILEKFVQGYELILNKLFNKKDSLSINFDEFCNLMFDLGFIRYDHIEIEAENQDQKNQKNDKKEKELSLLKDAWGILSASEDERIDTNQLLVFSAALLGLYKGGVSEDKPIKDNIVNTLPNQHDEPTALNTHANNNSNLTTTRKQKNTTKKKYQKFTSGSGSFTSTNRKSQKIDFYKADKENKNLLKIAVPELDINKYQYARNTVKHIKVLFRYMYDNRVNFLIELKKKDRAEKLNNKIKEVGKSTFASAKLRQSAENFRKRIYEEVENERNDESNSKSPYHFDTKVKRKLRLDQVYDLMRKKKEK
jgi:hypothetical protein